MQNACTQKPLYTKRNFTKTAYTKHKKPDPFRLFFYALQIVFLPARKIFRKPYKIAREVAYET